MRFKTFALGAAVAAAALSAPASAAMFITDTSPVALTTTDNDFKTQLNGLGLTHQVVGANVSLDTNAWVTFELLGSESNLVDSFWVNGVQVATENNNAWGSILIGTYSMAGGVPLNIAFSGGQPGAPGNARFALFTNANGGGINSQTIIFGYDDTQELNDNHDDFIVRATITAVPEASTWAMMIAGFAAVGFAARRRSQSARVSFS